MLLDLWPLFSKKGGDDGAPARPWYVCATCRTVFDEHVCPTCLDRVLIEQHNRDALIALGVL